jgi:predicted O-methyltransferase YrrM
VIEARQYRGTTIMARNARTAARAVAIQQNEAAQTATRWMFAAAGLAAALALAGALAVISG